MLRANQQLLLQEVNVGLLQIRNIELQYYQSFYQSFGTQAALIGGFSFQALSTYQDLSQAPNRASPEEGGIGSDFYDSITYIYSIAAAITVCAALHCVFTTILLQVLGPGLALFGPLGSMVPANEGMRAEMKQVFVAYFVMVLSFSVQLCSVFWLTMPLPPSIICTICFAGFSRNWYIYCVRIYNRFQFADMWNKNQDAGMGDVNNLGTFVDSDDPLQQLQTKEFEMYEKKKKAKEDEARKQEEAAANASTSSGLGAKMMHMIKGTSGSPLASQEVGNGENNQQAAEEGRAAAAAAAVIMSKEEFKKIVSFRRLEANKLKPNTVIKEGYMSKKGDKGMFGGEAPWNRRFFVLYQGGDLKYFKTKELSRDPKSALKELPIQIENYRVLTTLEPKTATATGGNGFSLGEAQTTGRARSDSTETDASISSAVEGSRGWGKAIASTTVKTPSVDGYYVYLMPVREMLGESFDKHRVWAFRCDTQKEQREWLDKLVALSAKPILSNQGDESSVMRSI